jgi:hypothetical protein
MAKKRIRIGLLCFVGALAGIYFYRRQYTADHPEAGCRAESIRLMDGFFPGMELVAAVKKLSDSSAKFSIWQSYDEISSPADVGLKKPVTLVIEAGTLPDVDYYVSGREVISLSFNSSAHLISRRCDMILTGP